MHRKSFPFWQNIVFTDETRVRIAIDWIVFEFVRHFLKKNTKNFDFGQAITYVFGMQNNQMDGNCFSGV